MARWNIMARLLKGKLALVTGASGDIGSDIALLFAQEGAKVVATYAKSEDRAKELQKKGKSFGLDIWTKQLDVTQEEKIDLFFKDLDKDQFFPDIIVNTAGHSDRRIWFSKPEELTNDDWVRVYNVDVVGSFRCSVEAAKRMMERRGGCIINFSSAAGVTGHTEGLPYTAAKAALIALTKSLAFIYGPKVRVNAIAPGNIDAGSIKWYNAEQVETMKLEASLRRLGTRREVSTVALFLASDLSSYITGQTILVDGGI